MSRDDQLQKAVLAELNWELSINAAHIGVVADNGAVTLTGHAESYGLKHAAKMEIGRNNGVKAIAEEIEIRLPFLIKRDDADIATPAAHRIARDTSTPHDAVKIKVEKGWLTLTGKVDWHFQKEAAEREVHQLLGVVGVTNSNSIKPHVDTTHISQNIQHALHRSWFSPNKVHVSAMGGRVKLTGTVDTGWNGR